LLLFPVPAQAETEIAAGRFDRAEALLRQAEKDSPQDFAVLYRLGLVLLKLEKNAEASERLRRAVALNPESANAWLALAEARMREGSLPAAVEAAGRAAALATGNNAVQQAQTAFRMRAMDAYIERAEPDKAIELGEKMTAAGGPDSAAVHHLLGRAYAMRKDPARAVAGYQQAIRADPGQAVYYAELARYFLEHRTPEPAVILLEDAVRRFPSDTEILRLKGMAYYARGRNREALHALMDVLKREPDRLDVWAFTDPLIAEAGDRGPEFARMLEEFCSRHPSAPLGYYLVARVPGRDAEALLRKAIAASAEFWPAHFELHKLLKERGESAQAVEALEKVISLNPAFAPAHYAAAQLYSALGDHQRARREREIHHRLSSEQRAAAEKQNEATPRLSYEAPPR
jgi:tetratricopeptide (TPR) repeat protein